MYVGSSSPDAAELPTYNIIRMHTYIHASREENRRGKKRREEKSRIEHITHTYLLHANRASWLDIRDAYGRVPLDTKQP